MLALLLALFISSPYVLGVEFHFNCELRDATSVSPEHGELVLTANMDRLPTEAELLQEYGEIYQLHETELQGPFLRAGEIFIRYGSKQSQSSWTIKKVTRYQALLFYWGRKHGHTFDFRPHTGFIPNTPGSERVCSFGGGPSGAQASLFIPDTPPVGGGRCVGGSLAARSSGGGGSARGPICGVAPPRPAYAPTPQVQGRASKSPVTEVVNKPAQGKAQGPSSAAHQLMAQPGPIQAPPAGRGFATFYRQSVCIQQLHYDPISMKLMQTICCAMGIPDPLTAVQDAAEQAMAQWCSMALQRSESSEGASLQQVLANFQAVIEAMGEQEAIAVASEMAAQAQAAEAAAAAAAEAEESVAAGEEAAAALDVEMASEVASEAVSALLSSQLTEEGEFALEDLLEAALQSSPDAPAPAPAPVAPVAVLPVASTAVVPALTHAALAHAHAAPAAALAHAPAPARAAITQPFRTAATLAQAAPGGALAAPTTALSRAPAPAHAVNTRPSGPGTVAGKRPLGPGLAQMNEQEQLRQALRESRSAGRQLAAEWLYGSGSGGAGAGGAVSDGAGPSSGGAGSSGAGSRCAGSHGAVFGGACGGAFAAPTASLLIPIDRADEEAEMLRPGLSFGQGVLPAPPAHPYIFFLHGHRRVEATSFPTTTYSFTHNMVIQWALMQHGLPTPETVMGYAPIEQILPEVEAYLDSHDQHQIWEAFQALVATVQPYQVQTLLAHHGGVLPTYLEDFEQEQVMDSWGLDVQLAQIQHQLDTAFAAGPSARPCGEGVIEEPPCMHPDSGLSSEDRQAYMRIGRARQQICSIKPRDVVNGLLNLRDLGVLDPRLSDALGPIGQVIPAADLESLMEDLGYMSTLRIGPLQYERHWAQCLRTLRTFLEDHKTYVWSAQGRQHQRHLLLEPDWVRFQLMFNSRSTQQTVRVIGPGAAELGTLLAENYPDSERNPVGRQNDLDGLRRQGFRSISVQHDLTKDDEERGLLDGLEPGTEAPLAPAMYALRRLLLTLPMVEVLILRASRSSHAQQLQAARAAAEVQAALQAQANGGVNFGHGGLGGRGGRGGQGRGFRPPRSARGRGLP